MLYNNLVVYLDLEFEGCGFAEPVVQLLGPGEEVLLVLVGLENELVELGVLALVELRLGL